jgi:hypothetical protein
MAIALRAAGKPHKEKRPPKMSYQARLPIVAYEIPADPFRVVGQRKETPQEIIRGRGLDPELIGELCERLERWVSEGVVRCATIGGCGCSLPVFYR